MVNLENRLVLSNLMSIKNTNVISEVSYKEADS
jgi:hypothetical protein